MVAEEARIAPQTSLAPSYDAWNGSFPIFRCRSMFSRTTMALSTSIPTAKEIPARLTTFRFRPKIHRKMKVPITLIGIAVATITVEERLRRKTSSTKMASAPPIAMFCLTSPIAPRM